MEKTPEVYKSNSLIEASYRLTPAEQGIILSCIAQIRKDEDVTDQTMYNVSVADYAKITGTNINTAYRDVKKAVVRLWRREVRIYKKPNGNEKHEETLVTRWIQSIKYSDKNGRVELRFSKDMLPYLTKLSSCFTKYELKNVAKMSSSHGIRLYEALTEWKDKYKTEEYEISVNLIRKIFQTEGSYTAIKDFKKRVLEPAIADVNTHSDLSVAWTQRKTGRKITHLKFRFKEKNQKNKKKLKQENLESWKSHIEKHARAGESWEEASTRLKKEKKSDLVES